MKWTIKAGIQRVLSRTPMGPQLYYLAQRYAGGFSNFTIDSKVGQGTSLLECLTGVSQSLSGCSTVEIGTGWTPILPILFWLNGQEHCDTYDNQKLLKDSLVVESARQFVALYRSRPALPDTDGQRRFSKRLALLEKLLADGAGGPEILRSCKIHYHAPVDAANTGLASGSVDVVYSNTMLEHAREDEISELLRECHRILKPGGLMLHLIDLSDHFAHSDQTISTINFLQFSEKQFSKYNSQFLYQNRFREPRWRQIIQDHNFEIVSWKPHVNSRAMAQLTAFKLDPRFNGLSSEELCVSSIHVIARRPTQ